MTPTALQRIKEIEIHKMRRNYATFFKMHFCLDKKVLPNDKCCNFYWRKVTCKKCLKLRSK
jgi:hypothetical protein